MASFGYSGDGGPATQAALNNPNILTLDPAGNLIISDENNNRIRKVTNGVITTLAGNGVQGYAGDGGLATAAALYAPVDAAFDAAGNTYIADGGNNRIRIVLLNNAIMTVAGTGSSGYSGDGGLATAAAIGSPHTLEPTSSGGFYFADNLNNRIRLLTPVAPSVGTIESASGFGGFPVIAPGTWIEIYGSNLAADTRSWASSDFSGINAPTSLDGTKVTLGGQAAFIDYISPGQVNALVPSSIPTGPQQITVTTAQGTSSAYAVTVNPTEPGLLAPPSFNVGGALYAVAIFTDGSYALPTGAIAGISSKPAKPGDVLTLYGIGFGPVVPAQAAGQLVQQVNMLASGFQVFLGGVPATVLYAGLAPDFTGLYQFNIVVPAGTGSGAIPLTFALGGTPGAQTLFIAAQN